MSQSLILSHSLSLILSQSLCLLLIVSLTHHLSLTVFSLIVSLTPCVSLTVCHSGSAFIVLEKNMYPCEAARCQFGVSSLRVCFGCTKLLCTDCAGARCGEYGRKGHQCLPEPRTYLKYRRRKRITIAAVCALAPLTC